MKTFERDPGEQQKSHAFRAPMMALVNPDPVLMFPAKTTLVPQLFLRNTTAAPLSATLTLNWRSANLSGTLPVSAVRLAPRQTRVLDLTASSAGLRSDAYWATVVLEYQGRSGDLVPIAASFDGTGRYGLQTPFSEGVAHLWKGSMWHADNFDTVDIPTDRLPRRGENPRFVQIANIQAMGEETVKLLLPEREYGTSSILDSPPAEPATRSQLARIAIGKRAAATSNKWPLFEQSFIYQWTAIIQPWSNQPKTSGTMAG